MRLLAIALLSTAACVPPAGRVAGPAEEDRPPRRATPDLDAARELDQQGVRAFRDGHYADAIRFFRAAYTRGAPSSELWNIARSRERMDDAEAAAGAIEQYLAQPDLSAQDRGEAERELSALRGRTSLLTVTTVPSGAMVTVDGRSAPAPTPVTVEVRPGAHTLSIRHEGYADELRPLEARFGHAILVSVDLARPARRSR